MADLILPSNGDAGYNFAEDIQAFNNEMVTIIRNHPKLHIATMIGVMDMLAADLHHNAIANVQHNQMAQDALARVQQDRIRKGIQ